MPLLHTKAVYAEYNWFNKPKVMGVKKKEYIGGNRSHTAKSSVRKTSVICPLFLSLFEKKCVTASFHGDGRDYVGLPGGRSEEKK